MIKNLGIFEVARYAVAYILTAEIDGIFTYPAPLTLESADLLAEYSFF